MKWVQVAMTTLADAITVLTEKESESMRIAEEITTYEVRINNRRVFSKNAV